MSKDSCQVIINGENLAIPRSIRIDEVPNCANIFRDEIDHEDMLLNQHDVNDDICFVH